MAEYTILVDGRNAASLHYVSTTGAFARVDSDEPLNELEKLDEREREILKALLRHTLWRLEKL